MAKYCGIIGFAVDEVVAPGVHEEKIVERKYYGDLIRNRTTIQQNNVINGSIRFSNDISIIADPFAYENFYSMRYVTMANKKWCIDSVEIDHPRLKLTIGGLYNG